QRVGARDLSGARIAGRGPPKRSTTGKNVGVACCCNRAAVGQFVRSTRQSVQPLASVVEPLSVQDCIHLRGRRHLYRPAERPGITKGLCGFTTTEETRAVACRKRDRLVQEEQLCPTAASHHVAVPSFKFTEAGEPGLGRPAPFQKRPSRRVMNDPTIAGEHASLRYRDDVSERRHPVLQRHWIPFKSSAARRPASDRSAEAGRDRATVRRGYTLAAAPPRHAVCRR